MTRCQPFMQLDHTAYEHDQTMYWYPSSTVGHSNGYQPCPRKTMSKNNRFSSSLNTTKLTESLIPPISQSPPFSHFNSVVLSIMPSLLSEKSRKHTTPGPYARKPGPKGPRPQSQPASASKCVKQPSKQLTNHDWLTVFSWIDDNPHRSQQDVVDHFGNRREGPLHFNQATLSRKLKKRCDIETMVKVNPAALSARRQRIVVAPEVERALVHWVQDMLSNGRIVNGPMMTSKRKILEDKFDIPPEKCLSDKGWLPSFYKA